MIFTFALKNLKRHPLRTGLTILGMAIAVTAFCMIRSAIDAWYLGAQAASPNRLVARNAVSLVFPLPVAYVDRVAKVPGVTGVSHGNWFGGVYIDKKNFFAKFAVDKDSYFQLFPEFLIDSTTMTAFKRDRNAALIGRKLADRFGWKAGDAVHIEGDIYPGGWDFIIAGIYTGAKSNTDESAMVFRFDYLDERMREESPGRAGQIGWLIIQIADPTQAAQISAKVDELFKNSLAETKTETEEAFGLSFIAMSATIITGMRIISYLVIGIILLVLGNTMAMTARERINEYAVLKTLGFQRGKIVSLIIGESMCIALIGGLLGFGLTMLAVPMLEIVMSNFLPTIPVTPLTITLAASSAVAVGLLSAVFPIAKALRTKIVDGLRVVE